jgi:hypothetical protein
MKHVRQNLAAIKLLRDVPQPRIHAWTGNLAFNRSKGKRFEYLANMLRDNEFESFCSAVGFIATNFALYEGQLLNWCQVMFVTLKWRGEGRSEEGAIPRPFSRKVRYLRSGFNKIPALKDYREEGNSLLDRGVKISPTRDDLVHSVITSIKSNHGKFELLMKEVGKDGGHKPRAVVFDVRDFPKLTKNLLDLGRDAILFSNRLTDVFQSRRSRN